MPEAASNFKDPNQAYCADPDFLRRSADKGWSNGAASTASEDDATVLPWPVLAGPAFHGLVGEIARAATEHSEVDPVAIVATALTYAGAVFGRSRSFQVGDTDHHGRLFAAMVGNSSRARKGSSFDPVHKVFTSAQEQLQAHSTLPFPSGHRLRIGKGLSSGEGLIDAIRDARDEEDEEGVKDKRLLCLEGEFASVLRACQRQGNTLSSILRTAWDGISLEPLTKNNKISVTDPHICIVAHVTNSELRSLLTAQDLSNGFANRFAWFAVRRQKSLPIPKPMDKDKVSELGAELAEVIKHVHSEGSVLTLSNSAADHWANVYAELTVDHPGLLGSVTSRAEAQVLRMAMIYAQLDGAARIELQHMESALALWRYSFDSAAYIFGSAEADPIAQRIVEALRTSDKTQAEISKLFSNNLSKETLDAVLRDLQGRGRITYRKLETGSRGRPPMVWSLTLTN